ncbi:hypothetical protein BGC07_15380 [Piscirickettsia litoralis]|uniref:Integral membrane bound transporter domain-containing protein n=2 Tax=Piscirickettsia litoralis TaxID=1891921 RepID=A0ABX2ZY01_9GAMM|nr:hypothetical protein BGC07_15380 [Piscirickettsia litoralis]
MDAATTRYKGYQRLAGCFAGFVVALIIIDLNIQSFVVIILIIAVFTFLFNYLHFGHSHSSYFGTQASVVHFFRCS